MPKSLNLINTLKGSLLEGFYPKGWDLKRIDRCCAMGLKAVTKPAKHWDPNFKAVATQSVAEMDERMGNAIADEILSTRKEGRKLAIILPVGPMGMYRTVVSRLKKSGVKADHVHTFNMDEWSDRHGNTMPGDQPGGFENAMNGALFAPLGKLTVPRRSQELRNEAGNLPTYPDKIAKLKADGGKAGDGLWHRPSLSHRVLGAATRGGIFARRLEAPNPPPRRRAPPPDHRAKRPPQLQQPLHPHPLLRQLHRPRPIPEKRFLQRRPRRRLPRPRSHVAGNGASAFYPPIRPPPSGCLRQLDAHNAVREIVFS